jgi:protocatechuate 3,4-dioxygenase beta subunit
MAVRIKGKKELITQCYIKGHELNEKDGVYQGIRDLKQRESVTLDFNPLKDSKAGELTARWDVVLGFTPEG